MLGDEVWTEFHEPKLPGLCANVVMVFPSSDQGLAKEINLSCWESGKAQETYMAYNYPFYSYTLYIDSMYTLIYDIFESYRPSQPSSKQRKESPCPY